MEIRVEVPSQAQFYRLNSTSSNRRWAREVHVRKHRCFDAVNAIRLGGCRRTYLEMFAEPSAKREGSRDVEMFYRKLSASAKKLNGKERTLRAS